MIVDCYTHTWNSDERLGRCAPARSSQAVSGNGTPAAEKAHWEAAQPIRTTIVLGFKSHYLEAEISNDDVAAYVGQNGDRLVGFAGIDPSAPEEAIHELKRARRELSMRGVAVAPAAQDFHPSNSKAMLVYAEVAALGLPVLFHTGVHMTAATKLEYARPFLLDEVAREFPKLKIIVAQLGYPWVHETLVLLDKHENVFAETSGLFAQPWQAYQALLSAYQHGVAHKLLFGSGFPNAVASDCIEAIYSVNHLCNGTNLPSIPREHLRGIVERDSLTLLGIDGFKNATPSTPSPIQDEEELESA